MWVLLFRSVPYSTKIFNGPAPRIGRISYISSDTNTLAGLSGAVIGTVIAILVNLFAGILLIHIIAWKIAFILLATLPILLYSEIMLLRVLLQI